MVGMATNILPGEATREGGHTGDETIREAGGFAQVGLRGWPGWGRWLRLVAVGCGGLRWVTVDWLAVLGCGWLVVHGRSVLLLLLLVNCRWPR